MDLDKISVNFVKVLSCINSIVVVVYGGAVVAELITRQVTAYNEYVSKGIGIIVMTLMTFESYTVMIMIMYRLYTLKYPFASRTLTIRLTYKILLAMFIFSVIISVVTVTYNSDVAKPGVIHLITLLPTSDPGLRWFHIILAFLIPGTTVGLMIDWTIIIVLSLKKGNTNFEIPKGVKLMCVVGAFYDLSVTSKYALITAVTVNPDYLDRDWFVLLVMYVQVLYFVIQLFNPLLYLYLCSRLRSHFWVGWKSYMSKDSKVGTTKN